MDKTEKRKLKVSNDEGLWSFFEEPDCDPSCWECEDEGVDWDALDEMIFGDL